MSVHLITGYAGKEHITSADQGSFNASVMGGGEFVLEGGEQFRCQVVSNNKVRIYDGEALMQGRHIKIERNTYEETTHDNGTQGYKRIDLIVLTYSKHATTGVESVSLDVIKGTPAESNPVVPNHVTGDVLNLGDLENQMPLYKIPFDGLSIGEPVALFSTVPTLETTKRELNEEVDAKKAELDRKFATLEAGIDEKISEAGKPLVSDIEEMKMIANYGEYSADAKSVGEIATAFQDGCETIVAGCTTYGSKPATNSPADIVNSIKTIYTNRYNAGVSATKKGTAGTAQVLEGYTFTNANGVGLAGAMANKTTSVNHKASSVFEYNNANLYFAVPANGLYSTGNRIYAANADVATAIGLTAAKLVKGNTVLGIAGTGGMPTCQVCKTDYGVNASTATYTATAAGYVIVNLSTWSNHAQTLSVKKGSTAVSATKTSSGSARNTHNNSYVVQVAKGNVITASITSAADDTASLHAISIFSVY